MGSVERRVRSGKVRWYARYRDPAGAQKTKTFNRKVDAERCLVRVEAAKLAGSYVDSKQAARTLADVAEEHWRAYAHTLAEDTTRPMTRSRLDRQILPVLGDCQQGDRGTCTRRRE